MDIEVKLFDMEHLILFLIGIGIIGLAYAAWKTYQVFKKDEGNQQMKDISSYIRSASFTFLKTEYKVLSVFILLIAVLLFLQSRSVEDSNMFVAVSFIVGAGLSALAASAGFYAASNTNSRTIKSVEGSIDNAFKTAFTGGSASGIAYISIAVTGLAILFFSFQIWGMEWGLSTSLNVLTAYALGASTVALFDRIIGGVFAQAANDGKELVLDTEEAIPANTAVNPAEIANNAGANANNVSGTGSDLFESVSIAIIAGMLLGIPFVNSDAVQSYFSLGPILLPLAIVSVGILASITGSFMVRTLETSSFWTSYRFSYYTSTAIMAIASFFVIKYMLPAEWEVSKTVEGSLIITKFKSLGIFWSLFIGLASAIIINLSTKYFTINGKPVNTVVEKSFKGSSSNVLAGISGGFLATAVPAVTVAGVIIGSYYFAGFYGVAIAAAGLLANTGLILAINSYYPIVDNADSLAKMTAQDSATLQATGELKAVGNQKELVVKSLTISAAALTASALFSAFATKTNISLFELSNPLIVGAVLIGALIPFLFSATVINAVGEVTNKIVVEVNRQFTEIPELKATLDIYKKYFGDPGTPDEEEQAILDDAEGKAEYNDLVTSATYNAIRELIIPMVIAIAIPALTGYFLGAELLAALLTGLIPTGFVLAISQANSGALWNSTKNEVAKGITWNGETYGKNSALYDTAKVGDTTGKTLRNASAPALNILIKLSVIIALVIASGIL